MDACVDMCGGVCTCECGCVDICGCLVCVDMCLCESLFVYGHVCARECDVYAYV